MSTGDPTLAERVELFEKWDSGTYPSPEDCARDHFARHGQDFGTGTTLWEYLRAAALFDRATARRVPPAGARPDGTIRFVATTGTFLVEKDGRILSFGKNPRTP